MRTRETEPPAVFPSSRVFCPSSGRHALECAFPSPYAEPGPFKLKNTQGSQVEMGGERGRGKDKTQNGNDSLTAEAGEGGGRGA